MLAISDSGAPIWADEKCTERLSGLEDKDAPAFWMKIADWLRKQEKIGSVAHILWADACVLKLWTIWDEQWEQKQCSPW
jgi:hypothetical protein